MIVIKLFNVTFVTIRFILNAITLIILTLHFFKIPMILDIVFSVAVTFFNLILWKIIKNFSMYVSNFHNNDKPVKTLNNETSLLLKPSENLKLLVNQFNNNASPEDNTDPEDSH